MSSRFNPPAFPTEAQSDRAVPPEHDYIQAGIYTAKFPGMSLRDYFAAHAMAAVPLVGCGADLDVNDFAAACYQFADAMLTAREKARHMSDEARAALDAYRGRKA